VASVKTTLEKLETGLGEFDPAERQFLIERISALKDFFDALDGLTRAVARLEGLGLHTVKNILSILK
jgi:hypothetical protein